MRRGTGRKAKDRTERGKRGGGMQEGGQGKRTRKEDGKRIRKE